MKRSEGSSEFEIFLKKVLQKDLEEGRGLPCPEKFREIIANVEIRRGKKRLKRMGKKLVLTLLILGVMSTSLYLCFPEKVGEARRLINTITHLFMGDITIITGGSNYPFFADNPKDVVERIIRIKGMAPMEVKLPMYVPAGFTVADVVSIDEAGQFTFSIFFSDGECRIILTQLKSPNTAGRLLQDLGSNQGESVCILGNKGFLVKDADGNYGLNVIDENFVHFIIRGDIAEEEVLKIARSLH